MTLKLINGNEHHLFLQILWCSLTILRKLKQNSTMRQHSVSWIDVYKYSFIYMYVRVGGSTTVQIRHILSWNGEERMINCICLYIQWILNISGVLWTDEIFEDFVYTYVSPKRVVVCESVVFFTKCNL